MSFSSIDPANPDEFKSHLSEDQQLMRREMEADFQALRSRRRQPQVLKDVFEEMVSVPSSDVEVTQEAWAIIEEQGTGLVLGFNQWAIVQRLVEAGIVSGRARS